MICAYKKSKVIKKLRYILVAVVGGIVALFITIGVIVSLPPVKKWMGEQSAQFISDAIGSRVNVAEMQLSLPGSASLSNVLIYDQQGKQMLKAKSIEFSVELLPILNGDVNISNLKVIKADLQLYKTTADDKPNFQFVIDSLSPKPDSESKVKVNLKSLLCRDVNIKYDVLDSPKTGGLFDANHIEVKSFFTSLVLRDLSKEHLYARIRDFGFETSSGLKVSKFQGEVGALDEGKRIKVDLKNLEAAIANKQLDINLSNSKFVVYTTNVADNKIELLDEIDCFCTVKLPEKVYKAQINAKNSMQANGRPIIAKLSIKSNDSKFFDADIKCGYSPMKSAKIEFNLDADKQDAHTIANLFDVNLPQSELLDEFAFFEQQGCLDILNSKVEFDGTTHTAKCDIDEQLVVRGNIVDFELDINKLQLPKTVLENNLNLTNCVMKGNAGLSNHQLLDVTNLTMSEIQNELSAAVAMTIEQICYNDQTINGIELKSNYAANNLKTSFKISDNNINSEGEFILNDIGKGDNLTVNVDAKSIRPSVFGLTGDNIPSVVSGSVSANVSNLLNKWHDCHIDLRNLCLTMHENKEVWVGDLAADYRKDGESNLYTCVSDWINVRALTNLNISEIADMVKSQVFVHMPSLGEAKRIYANDYNGYLRLDGSVKDISSVAQLFGYDISLYNPAEIHGSFSTNDNSTMSIYVPQVELDGARYDNVSVYYSNHADSLSGNVMLTKYFGESSVRIENSFACACNNLRTESLWRNLDDPTTNGYVATVTNFNRDASGLNIVCNVLPSKFYISDTLWQIAPATLSYNSRELNVDGLKFYRGNQYANINANLQNNSDAKDVLVELNDMEVAYLLKLANFKPVEFSGKASGILKNDAGNNGKDIAAHLQVTDFKFNRGDMGMLNADAVWNSEDNLLTFNARTQRSEDDSTLINGGVDIGNKTLDIRIKSEKTNLQFLNKFVGRFIADLEGTTSGDFHLFGTLKDVNMEADECINMLKFRPKMLGALYMFENDSVHIRPDSIHLTGMTLRDVYGNTTKITGGVYHHFLYRFNYNFGFDMNNFLLLNWNEDPSRAFWGTVFANGKANLYGNTQTVFLDGELESAGAPGSSILFYTSETASADDSNSEYMHFITPEEKYSTAKKENGGDEADIKDTSTDVYMKFKFDIKPDATLNIITDPKTKDYMSLNGNGPIRMAYYNKGKFELNGLYSVVGGNYTLTIKDLIRRNFAMQPGGFLRFNGNPSDGDLMLKGVHTIKSVSLSDLNVGASQSNSTIGVDCILNFTGKASDPKVSFDLDFPNANSDENRIIKKLILTEEDRNMQVVYLLSIGRFYTYNYNTFESGGQSQSSVAMSSFLAGTLSSQINNVLQDAFNVSNWNFGTNISTGRMGFNDMEVQGSLSGKMFNNRLLFNGNIGYRDQATTYSNSFIGDFNLQWLLNKVGTIRLKAYSETNDRYFTKSSLTTQGGGVLFLKDFNKFSDFFKRK